MLYPNSQLKRVGNAVTQQDIDKYYTSTRNDGVQEKKGGEVGKKTAKNATVDAMGSQSPFKSYINSSQAMWLRVGNKKRHQLR